MSEGYRRRHVRPLYPEIPESICDCELLARENCSQREDLVHTQELASESCDAPVDEGRHHVSYTRVHLRCPMCGQIDVAQWLAARTGLPNGRERYVARAAANYWLPIRRAQREAERRNRGA